MKVAPPLRSEDERLGLVEALASGLIDVIVSDHDPQDVEAKRVPFSEAEYGAVGLETMLAAGLRLVHAGQVSLGRLIGAMTLRSACGARGCGASLVHSWRGSRTRSIIGVAETTRAVSV